jgi:polysaccharide export outer membrane protein
MARSFRIARTALICLALLSVAGLANAEDEKEKKAKQDEQEQANPAAPSGPAEGPSDGEKPATSSNPDAPGSSYVIGPEDQLLVRVWREPELSGQVSVRPDGKITIQLLNEVQAAGLTPEQLAAKIREGLSATYMKDPQVTVEVKQIQSKKFVLIGEVNKPGPYPLLTPTTVFEAIGLAGGFREFAKQNKISIMRKGQRIPFNYKDFVKGKKPEQNILLENGDTIIVP